MNIFKIFVFFVLVNWDYAAFATGSPALHEWSWNTLLHTQNLFVEELDRIQATSIEKADIFRELKDLVSNEEVLSSLYSRYVTKFHNKQGRSNRALFGERLLEIAQHNLDAMEGKHSWSKGVNKFTDMTKEEIQARFNRILPKASNTNEGVSEVSFNLKPLQVASVDWNATGHVTPVKNQGTCGSCYSFAAIAALESAYAIKNKKKFVDLSEQQIIDCTLDRGNLGCGGGNAQITLKYLQEVGVTTEANYAYNEFISAVANGPIHAAIHANDEFSSYFEGVFDSNCEKELNIEILIVGFGNENGKDFWLIKNSYGSDWGIDGFMKMKRGKNICGIASDAYLVRA